MSEVIRVLLTCLAAIFAGVILGNGAVYFFNRIPYNVHSELYKKEVSLLLISSYMKCSDM